MVIWAFLIPLMFALLPAYSNKAAAQLPIRFNSQVPARVIIAEGEWDQTRPFREAVIKSRTMAAAGTIDYYVEFAPSYALCNSLQIAHIRQHLWMTVYTRLVINEEFRRRLKDALARAIDEICQLHVDEATIERALRELNDAISAADHMVASVLRIRLEDAQRMIDHSMLAEISAQFARCAEEFFDNREFFDYQSLLYVRLPQSPTPFVCGDIDLEMYSQTLSSSQIDGCASRMRGGNSDADQSIVSTDLDRMIQCLDNIDAILPSCTDPVGKDGEKYSIVEPDTEEELEDELSATEALYKAGCYSGSERCNYNEWPDALGRKHVEISFIMIRVRSAMSMKANAMRAAIFAFTEKRDGVRMGHGSKTNQSLWARRIDLLGE